MKKSNKILIGMFLLAIASVLTGSFLKLNGNNGDIFLGIAIIFNAISIVGLIYTNRAKLRCFLS